MISYKALVRARGILGLLRWILAWAAGAAVGAVLQRGFQPAAAEHSYSPHLHLRSQMYDSDPETTCVDVHGGGSLSQPGARQRVASTLVSASHPNEDWHGVDYVYFYGQIMYEECPWVIWPPLSESLRFQFTEVRYPETYCGQGTVGCTKWTDEWGTRLTEGHAARVHIYIKDSAFNTRVINHEVGHALGLCDGGPDVYAHPACDYSLIARDCTGSVMHSYGCGNSSDWPTAFDRLEVERVSHGGGAGGLPFFGGDICNRGFC